MNSDRPSRAVPGTPGGRRQRILAALQPTGGGTPPPRLCQVAADVVGMTGAGIMLMSGDYPTGSICSTDGVSRRLEELQYELGEGPCVDAYSSGSPVVAADLEVDATSWPAFGHMALEMGARAVFGFPLALGAVKVGALNLYRDRKGDLTDDQHADALVTAEVLAEVVLLLQADAPPGALASVLSGSELHLVVHQAAGMVSVQLGVTMAVALVRLRAWAFAHERRLDEVAHDVVSRVLRFDGPDGPDGRDELP